MLHQWSVVEVLLVEQGSDPSEVENLWLFGELLGKSDKLNASLELLAEAHEDVERHKKEKVEIQARLDRFNEAKANAEALGREVAELTDKSKPTELMPRLEVEIRVFKVHAQKLEGEIGDVESEVALGEEEMKEANEERDQARLLGHLFVKESLATGLF